MFHIHEKDCEYRFGDSGPKYFMRGPRSGMGLARLKPGEDYGNHYHEEMEENFFVLTGRVAFVVDGIMHIGKKGDFFSMKPEEPHYLKNVGNHDAVVVFSLAPYKEGDKVNAPR